MSVIRGIVPELRERIALELAFGQSPAFVVDVEDDAVRIAELALEVVIVRIAKIEKELSARALDPLLLVLDVVALEAEVVDADVAVGVLQAGAGLALVLQQREVDLAVAHVDAVRGRSLGFLRAGQAERPLVEVRRRVQILHHEGDVADASHDVGSFADLSAASR